MGADEVFQKNEGFGVIISCLKLDGRLFSTKKRHEILVALFVSREGWLLFCGDGFSFEEEQGLTDRR